MSIQAEIKDLQERVAALELLIDANYSEETKQAWKKAVDDAGEIDAMSTDTDKPVKRKKT